MKFLINMIYKFLNYMVVVSILPEVTVKEDISIGRLAAIAWDEGALEVAALMIWYKDRWLSPTLDAFMETARKVLKKA